MGMKEINREEPTGDREETARWGEATPGLCGDTETQKGHFKMEGRPHKRMTKRYLLGVSTGSHFNFDQRNFWKQKLEARMNRVGERVGKVISGDDEK